ncbi:sodium:proton antiporter [Aeromicrobium sp. 9AM]|uniref:cation:proton antiporter n=1 Tax=Aeromicrobium sp. 9AM TaxID=2653126 RepID=UPI0012F03945|nr:cation:proton antiporter [Aeromicrobium sp. 9AM]VXB55438.1 Cation transporter [Aeromicrobium sp. 9AM]
MTTHLVYLLGGAALLLAVVLPYALRTAALSPPVVLLGLGALIGLLPGTGESAFSPMAHRGFVEHLAEFTVLIALMGVGLALDRPLSLRSLGSWRQWSAAWRMLAIAMPLSIAGVALLGWWVMGLAPSAALLLGAVLAPTDPVLASDVQVEGPTTTEDDEDEIDEDDEVRFALTSEAGLNDGLAFPFVQAAILLAATGPFAEWGVRWFAWDLVGKVVVGAALGIAVGWVLAKVAFRSRQPSLRTADAGEPLLAIAAVLLAYGLAEVAGGYGFLAVFACAMTLRSAERGHDYHALMHEVIERLERLLTLIVLLLLGVALTNGLLADLTWPAVLVAVLLLLVVRPVSGLIALFARRGTNLKVGSNTLGPRERAATAFFGVRGVGSIYYLAYASGHADFKDLPLLWSTVGFAITLSVLLHGVTATPAMRWLDAARGR